MGATGLSKTIRCVFRLFATISTGILNRSQLENEESRLAVYNPPQGVGKSLCRVGRCFVQFVEIGPKTRSPM